MTSYTVKYKPQGAWFFRRIRRVRGDCKLDETTKNQDGAPSPWPPTWVFFTESGERIEIPMAGTIFKFPKEREEQIKEQMRKEGAKF